MIPLFQSEKHIIRYSISHERFGLLSASKEVERSWYAKVVKRVERNKKIDYYPK